MMDIKKIYKPKEIESEYEDNTFKVDPGIHVSYSKRNNAYFINNVSVINIDSWGMDQDIEQSCLVLSATEFDEYIELLKDIRASAKEEKNDDQT